MLATAVLALSACDIVESGGPICTGQFVSGLQVSVQDSVTGAPVASGATLTTADGSYRDTVSVPAHRPDLDGHVLLAAGERPGTYDVTVSKTGYLDWQRSNVVVTADECHVIPVEITARLKPAP